MPVIVLAGLNLATSNIAINLGPYLYGDKIFSIDAVRRWNGAGHTHTLSRIALAHTHTVSAIALLHTHTVSNLALGHTHTVSAITLLHTHTISTAIPQHRHGISVARATPKTAPTMSHVIWTSYGVLLVQRGLLSAPTASTATTRNAAIVAAGTATKSLGNIGGAANQSLGNIGGAANQSLGNIGGRANTSLATRSGVATASGAVSQTNLARYRSGVRMQTGSHPLAANQVALHSSRSAIELGNSITPAFQLIVQYTSLRAMGGQLEHG